MCLLKSKNSRFHIFPILRGFLCEWSHGISCQDLVGELSGLSVDEAVQKQIQDLNQKPYRT
jgi:hypothetical protein